MARFHPIAAAAVLSSLLLVIEPLVAISAAQDVRVTPAPTTQSAGTFDLMQWGVDVGRRYDNPFDPQQIAVDAAFTAPSGKSFDMPAFWDGSAFALRFAPDEAGTWSMTVSAVDSSGQRTSAPREFQVVQSHQRGFVRRAANNRYFRYDDGESCFLIGLDMCWPAGRWRADWYDSAFKTLAENGGNFARVWMCTRDAMLETSATGLGRYDLQHAAAIDHVLEQAQKNGVNVMLCLLNHRELLQSDMWGVADWPINAYNAKNHGPATRPIDFFTDADARRIFKARLRYIVARFSAFTSVGFWEFFNEQEFARVNIPVQWNAEMAAYLRQIDPFQHLITTSAAVNPKVWEIPQIDLTQSHIYGDGTQVDMVTPLQTAESNHERFNKPHLVAEMGIDFHGPDIRFDPTGKGTGFHNALWAGLASGNAGTGMYWWWDNYIGPKDLWHEMQPVAAFVRGIDWAGKDFRPVPITQLWQADVEDSYADLTIAASGGWGATSRQPIAVPPNGRPTAQVPRYLYGPLHSDLHEPLIFDLDLPAKTDLVLAVAQVSDFAVVRISVDGNPQADLAFSALPGSADASNSHFSQQDQIYQADINQSKRISLHVSPGHHRISIDPIAGDWVTISSVTFTDALPARFANLAALAVQDKSSGQTLAWIWDPRSNWKDDQSQDSPPQRQDVRLTVPNLDSGNFTAQWWNTRRGQIIRTDSCPAQDGKLTVSVPPFTRDIALRLQPQS